MSSTLSSPLTPLSPTLGSPQLGSFMPAKLRNRVPKQVRRSIPVYLAFVLIVALIFNADVFVSSPSGDSVLFKRQEAEPASEYGGVPGFPRKIWQTWKTDPLGFEPRDLEAAKSWTRQNRGFRYEVLTDDNALGYLEATFGPDGFDRPDIVRMYREINATIIKADLLRYLLMYAEGGVYADIDVEAQRPVSHWVPQRWNTADFDMVIGIEIDQPAFRDHPILGQKSMSFCQWTFMAKPRLPVMLQLVENIMSWLSDMAKKQEVPISEVRLDFDEVISGTGPSAFTAAVMAEMNRNKDHKDKEVTWDDFHAMDERSKLVERVLVLDVEAFAAGQGHSDSGNHNSRGVLVKHHYHASNWPSHHPRYTHPVYGEVEHCNWEPGCVAKWDADTAAYEGLSEAEKQKLIAEDMAEKQRQLEEARYQEEQDLKLEQFLAAVEKAENEAKERKEAEMQASFPAQQLPPLPIPPHQDPLKQQQPFLQSLPQPALNVPLLQPLQQQPALEVSPPRPRSQQEAPGLLQDHQQQQQSVLEILPLQLSQQQKSPTDQE